MRTARVRGAIAAAAARDYPLALQVVGELYAAATHKPKLEEADATGRATPLLSGFGSFASSVQAVRAARDEAAKGCFPFWDSVLLTSAAEAG